MKNVKELARGHQGYERRITRPFIPSLDGTNSRRMDGRGCTRGHRQHILGRQYGTQHTENKKAWESVPKWNRNVGNIAPGNWEKICVYQSRDTKNDKSKRSTGICKEG